MSRDSVLYCLYVGACSCHYLWRTFPHRIFQLALHSIPGLSLPSPHVLIRVSSLQLLYYQSISFYLLKLYLYLTQYDNFLHGIPPYTYIWRCFPKDKYLLVTDLETRLIILRGIRLPYPQET